MLIFIPRILTVLTKCPYQLSHKYRCYYWKSDFNGLFLAEVDQYWEAFNLKNQQRQENNSKVIEIFRNAPSAELAWMANYKLWKIFTRKIQTSKWMSIVQVHFQRSSPVLVTMFRLEWTSSCSSSRTTETDWNYALLEIWCQRSYKR